MLIKHAIGNRPIFGSEHSIEKHTLTKVALIDFCTIPWGCRKIVPIIFSQNFSLGAILERRHQSGGGTLSKVYVCKRGRGGSEL